MLANVKLVEVEGVQLQFGGELSVQGVWDPEASRDLPARFTAMAERLVGAIPAASATARGTRGLAAETAARPR